MPVPLARVLLDRPLPMPVLSAAGPGPGSTAPHAGWAPLLWAPAVWSTTLWSGMAQATAASSLWWAPQRSSSTG